MNPVTDSTVEKYFLEKADIPFLSSTEERIPVITVDNYMTLGQLTALRFLEWITINPEGVVALPTGKTPEYFIKWVHHYCRNWKTEVKHGILKDVGLTQDTAPGFSGLHFVQLDEFFPISSTHERSFYHYVQKYYLNGFGFDRSRALLINTGVFSHPTDALLRTIGTVDELFKDGVIDLGLRLRQANNDRESMQQRAIVHFDQFCEEYEQKIKNLGGIGFFLGGIGPDGHIAFNVKGSSHFSTTRLTTMNYETMAAAAQDLGGIETVRKKAVITIGLNSITAKPDAVVLIIAAGQTKARIVADAIEHEPHINYPASSIQKLPNARFYLTNGAAKLLARRTLRVISLKNKKSNEDIEKLVVDAAISARCSLDDLKKIDSVKNNNTVALEYFKQAIQITKQKPDELAASIKQSIHTRIEKGLTVPRNQRIFHTAPHHDDIELAYFPLIHHLVRSPENKNFFCYMTNGFTSVTNAYLHEQLTSLRQVIVSGAIFKEVSRTDLCCMEHAYQDIHGFLNGIGQQNCDHQNLYTSIRLSRKLFAYLKSDSDMQLLNLVDETIKALATITAGQSNPALIQTIKGWIREWEAELVWAHFGLGYDNVFHLRLPFYSDQIFPEDPQYERDVVPILNLLERTRPTIVTLAMDPEGSGPDTHYKTLMAITAALEKYVEKNGSKDLRIWGYRNVWSRFKPYEVNTIIPVSLNSFAVLHSMFNSCFRSQASASFPSHELNGTFSELAQKIWVEQFNDLISLLGKNTFYDSTHPMMRRAFGAIYLQDMSYEEFIEQTKDLRQLMVVKKNVNLCVE